MLAKLKLVSIGVLVLLTVIIVLQNTTEVETEILFMRFAMPRAALLFLTFVTGYVVGVLTSGYITAKFKRKPESEE